MKPRDGLYFLLSLPSVYRLFRTIVQGDGCRVYVSEYVRPVPGEKVLDIGCGPGDILENLPAVDYLGFDINLIWARSGRKRPSMFVDVTDLKGTAGNGPPLHFHCACCCASS